MKSFVFLCLAFAFFAIASDEALSAPLGVRAFDTPNDSGSSITLEWDPVSVDVVEYVILRGDNSVENMEAIGRTRGDEKRYVDDKVKRGVGYYYLVRALDSSGSALDSAEVGPVVSIPQWFNRSLIPTAVGIIIFSGILIFTIYHAKSAGKTFIRRISGLDAIDEAIGRATEMGKSILYVSGTGSIRSIATIASMNILARVARMSAEYETALYAPCNDAIVMNIEREVVQNAHLDAGHPETYKPENIFFIAEEQFAYAAAVDGIIIREKPASIFYMGSFQAESLILAEVGGSVGAIQIAGTDSITQLPFFITACDYTLMGEELYAASAYLSKEPLLQGSLKGQDWGKLLVIAAILISAVMQIMGFKWFTNLL